MDKSAPDFLYLKNKFPRISEGKIKERESPQMMELMKDRD